MIMELNEKNVRAIEVAYLIHKNRSELRNINELLDGPKRFLVREYFNEKKISFICCECGKPLTISISHIGNIFLKHFKPNPCILKTTDSILAEEINRVNLSKESQRHKDLKSILISMLENTKGVAEISSEKWMKYKEQYGRPDVFCHYYGNKIAFEVQLSPISQRYIFYRYNFYKEQGIYLFWLLDNFNSHAQVQWEKDIKHLNKQQNIFQINESSTDKDVSLICQYKLPYIDYYKISIRWQKKKASLNDILFDDHLYQPYLVNYDDAHLEVLEELKVVRKTLAERALREQQIKASRESLIQNYTYEKAELIRLQQLRDQLSVVINASNEKIKELTEHSKDAEYQISKIVKERFSFSSFVHDDPSHKEKIDHVKSKDWEHNKVLNSIEENSSELTMFNSLPIRVHNNKAYRIMNPDQYKSELVNNRGHVIPLPIDYQEQLFSNQTFSPIISTGQLENYLREVDKYLFLLDLDHKIQVRETNVREGYMRINEINEEKEALMKELVTDYKKWATSSIATLKGEIVSYNKDLSQVDSEIQQAKIRVRKLNNKI